MHKHEGTAPLAQPHDRETEIVLRLRGARPRSQPLRMMPVDCGQNAVLGGFHFEFSEGGKWGRVRSLADSNKNAFCCSSVELFARPYILMTILLALPTERDEATNVAKLVEHPSLSTHVGQYPN